MSCFQKDVTFKVIFDILILCFIGVISLVLALTGTPYHRGFFCDDQSISHPYKGNTVTTLVLFIVSVGTSVVAIISTEIYLFLLNRRRGYKLSPSYARSKQTCFGRCNVHAIVLCCYQSLLAFAFGVIVNQAATDILKYSLGRLRPHFLDICQPNWDAFNCTNSRGFMRFVTDDVCTGTNAALLKDARLSHPSGHASLSFYCFVFLTLYTQSRMRWRGSRLLRHFLQVIVLYAALYISASRVSDYKHHWSDVLGGAILGTSVALLVAYFVADLYHMGPLCAAVKQYSHPSAAVAEDEKYNRRNDTWNDHQANQNFSPDANM